LETAAKPGAAITSGNLETGATSGAHAAVGV
jgi:hypothetical protein